MADSERTTKKRKRQPRFGDTWQHLGHMISGKITQVGPGDFIECTIDDDGPEMRWRSTVERFHERWYFVEKSP